MIVLSTQRSQQVGDEPSVASSKIYLFLFSSSLMLHSYPNANTSHRTGVLHPYSPSNRSGEPYSSEMSANEGSLRDLLLCESPSALQWVYPGMIQENSDKDLQEQRLASTEALAANCSETSFTTRFPVVISEFSQSEHLTTSKTDTAPSNVLFHLNNSIPRNELILSAFQRGRSGLFFYRPGTTSPYRRSPFLVSN